MASSSFTAWPIGIRLFNRPEHVRELLSSLASQSIPVEASSLTFSIDGFSGSLDEKRGRADNTAQVAALVTEYFPAATILQFASNVGIGESTFALQSKVFASGDSDWAIFLEEDIVLEPDFLAAMDHLIQLAQDHEEIVKVGTGLLNLGYLQIPIKPGRKNFFLGHGTKAFAERRTFFVQRRSLTEIYLATIAGRQYSDRDEEQVFATMAEHGVFTVMGNNDVVQNRITASFRKLFVVSDQSLIRDRGISGETNFVLPDIQLPTGASGNVLTTTAQDLVDCLNELKLEQHEFEQKFFKNFWGGYIVSKSGGLAIRVLLKKIKGFVSK
jgi:hypothetical protein